MQSAELKAIADKENANLEQAHKEEEKVQEMFTITEISVKMDSIHERSNKFFKNVFTISEDDLKRLKMDKNNLDVTYNKFMHEKLHKYFCSKSQQPLGNN